MSESRLTGETISYAIARIVAKDSEAPFNYWQICEEIYGRNFCTGQLGKRIVDFLRNAVRKGFLRKVNFDKAGPMNRAQHYMLQTWDFSKMDKEALANLDPAENSEEAT